MRLGLIGLGRIGAFHAVTLSGLDQVDSLVVYDAVPALVESAVQRVGAEPAASPEALLRAGVDGVVIAAATDVHPELIIACLEAGLPTFCEKPVSKDPVASMEILRRTEASGVPVQIGYPRRFDAAFAAAREAVASGSLGWLHTVRSTTLDPAPPPDAYVRASGGIFRDCSVHDFDAVRYVTGQEVVEVYATGSNQGAAIFADADDVDTAATVLTLESGTLAVVSNSRYNGRGHDVRLELHGSPTASPPVSRRGGRSGRPNRASASRAASRTTSSWTGSPTPSAPSWPRSPKWWTGRGRRPARLPTRSRSAGSPRPPTCLCMRIGPSEWTRSVRCGPRHDSGRG